MGGASGRAEEAGGRLQRGCPKADRATEDAPSQSWTVS